MTATRNLTCGALDAGEKPAVLGSIAKAYLTEGMNWRADYVLTLNREETALDIDLYEWWQPTAENYFSKISKDQIADAVQEAGFAERSRDVLKLKKGDAATLAQDILTDTRWVPDWMTRPQPLTATPSATDHAA